MIGETLVMETNMNDQHSTVLHNAFRGAVTGLGLVLIVFGCLEIFQLTTGRKHGHP